MSAEFVSNDDLLYELCNGIAELAIAERVSLLVALALCSSRFSQVALNALWRNLPSVGPLLNLLGCTAGTGYILVGRCMVFWCYHKLTRQVCRM